MRQWAGIVAISLIGCSSSNAKSTNPEVIFETNQGQIKLKLYPDKAPVTVKNFLEYVDAGYYAGTVFHRVIDGFMLQGGGFDADLKKKDPRPPIKNEANNGLKNKKGTLSMARTGDPNSATSQFFINLVDNAYLDHKSMNPREMGYAVFAEVSAGMDVVERIGKVRTKCPSRGRAPCTETLPPGMRDVPAQPVVITKAYRAP